MLKATLINTFCNIIKNCITVLYITRNYRKYDYSESDYDSKLNLRLCCTETNNRQKKLVTC